MKRLLSWLLFTSFSYSAHAADCIAYIDAKREGDRYELNHLGETYELPYQPPHTNWADVISSVWIRDGYYAVLSEHAYFQGQQVYLYGAGMAFAKKWNETATAWHFNLSNSADGGVWFNLDWFGLNDKASAMLCLKQ